MPENPPLNFAMSPDRTRVTVTPTVPGSFELTADQVDMLIRALIAGRTGMQPARDAYAPQELSRVLTADGMQTRLQEEGDGSGDVLLGLFHPGLGWLGSHCRKDAVAQLADALNEARGKAAKG
ncbi:hypothetical protein ACE7GA_02705 [Roseomonas sp. CCTCC AB2023176]|uniref:hypothetical protein n=1 Tax=Roseomonas sp. CCTCC AB2023176 TaxID=3342640 RepID=UPI0035D5D53E